MSFHVAIVLFACTAIGRVLHDPLLPYTETPPRTNHSAGLLDSLDLSGEPEFRTAGLGGLDFDPKVFANDDMWKQYLAKGEHLNCLMHATDKGAGFLINDKRTQPSAASKWSGDMRGMKQDKSVQTWLILSPEDLERWNWQYNDWDEGSQCDFEAYGLKKAFTGLGLNAKPAYDDDGEPADGHNECFSVTHYSVHDYVDPNAEFPQMKPTKDQKYMVDKKQYMVGRHLPGSNCIH